MARSKVWRARKICTPDAEFNFTYDGHVHLCQVCTCTSSLESYGVRLRLEMRDDHGPWRWSILAVLQLTTISEDNTTMTSSRRLALVAAAYILFLSSAIGVAAAAVEDGIASSQPQPLRVRFVNELPNTPIELYWENHNYAADDPVNSRILEAILIPRGGLHVSNSFVGHGKDVLVLLSLRCLEITSVISI